MYTLIHIEVRNDGNSYKEITVTDFETVEEASFAGAQQINADTDEIRINLIEGKSYWVWEWVRKGNGDFYQVVQKMDREEELNYIYNLGGYNGSDLINNSIQVGDD